MVVAFLKNSVFHKIVLSSKKKFGIVCKMYNDLRSDDFRLGFPPP